MSLLDIQIFSTPLSVDTCMKAVQDGGVGGIALFVGTVRNQTQGKAVTHLEFEAYEPMAISEMRKIAEQAQEKFGATKVSMHHRVGNLGIGEIAVIIAVATPHRKAAFAACQYAIDTLKETVPIWKKEFFENGAVWVAAHP